MLIENIPLENLAALLVIFLVAIFGRNKSLPLVIIVFYVLYMALDYAYWGGWNEPFRNGLTTDQEAQFNLLAMMIGVLVMLLCALAIQHEMHRIVEHKTALPNGKRIVYKWYSKLVIGTYALLVLLTWIIPYALQLVTFSYTWRIHAAIMENTIVIDIGLACLAQIGKRSQDGMKGSR